MPRPERQHQSGSRLHGGVLAGLALLLLSIQIWIFRWGVITPDTVEQYRQALTGGYEDWHPPVTAWLWRMLLNIHQGSAPLLVFDCALYWLGFGLVAEALRRRGQTRAALAAIVIGLLPIPFGQAGSILKDSLLASCCVAATGILAFHHLLDKRPGWLPVTTLLLVIAAATRFNGPLAVGPLLLFAFTPAVWRRPWRSLLPWLAAAVLVLALTGHLINTVLLHPRSTQPLLSLINFDLAGTSRWSGRNLYPVAMAPPDSLIVRCYRPAMFSGANMPECDAVEDRLSHYLKVSGESPFAAWADAVAADPWAYVRHRALHFNANQRWLVSHVPDDAVYIMSAWNDLGLSFVVRPAAVVVYRAATVMAHSPLGRPATWLAAAAGLLLLGARIRDNPLARALAASALLYGAAYAIVSVAPDMRYNNWPMIAVPLALLMLCVQRGARPVPPRRMALASAPVAVAVVGELAGMFLS